MTTKVALDRVRTVCAYCGVGCGIVLEVDRGGDTPRVVRSTGDPDHPVNRGRLCTKGATTAEMLNAPGRLTTALARAGRDEEPAPVDVGTALDLAAARLAALRDEHGPDAIGIYTSGQLSIEAQYLITKLAKGFLRTQYQECNSRLCMASAASGYKLSLGADAPPGSYDDFDHADVFLVIGANMADCHPILFLRMMDRVRAGAKLIVVDPRRTATADKADLFLQLRPGTDIALLNGLLHLLHASGAVDESFVVSHTEGWAAMPDLLAGYDPATVADITGVPEDDLRTAAALIAAAGNWMSCWTMGLNQSTHGTWNTNTLINLHLATGAICRTGSGPFSLTGQPNAMGGREMGYMGPGLPGQRSLLDPADRAHIEQLWGLPADTIRADHGNGTIGMFEQMSTGAIKAAWIICTNPVATVANRRTVIEGLETAEFVLVHEAFTETETTGYADVVLPAAVWAETAGVMVNSERNLTLTQPAADPPGQARADWQLIAGIAARLGYADHFTYNSAQEVFDELRQAWNPVTGWDLRGITHDRLRDGPMQWPAPPGAGARNPIRYLTDDGPRFPTPSGRAKFWPRPHADPQEMPDEQYPYLLNTGRLQHQWHTLTKTGRVGRLNKLNPAPFIEIHPDDAAALGISEGDQVEVASRRGRAVLPAAVTDRVQPGDCFAPFHWNDMFGEYLAVNATTSDAVDPVSLQPGFKASAVALTRVHTPTTAQPPPTVTNDVLPAGNVASALQAGDVASAAPVARLLGLAGTAAPALNDDESTYLAGFVAGLGIDLARGPLTSVPTLPPSAPVTARTALWVNGVLAGLWSRLPAEGHEISSGTGERRVLLGWASQTGNAERVAEQAEARLTESGAAVTRVSLNEIDHIAPRTDLVVVTSTFGDGESPDNGSEFLARLRARSMPLDDVRFSVIALGDSSYSDFCGHGRRIDELLAELGGLRLADRVDCEPDFDEAAQAWLDRVLAARAGASPARPEPAPAPAPPTVSRPSGASRAPRVSETHRVILAGNRLLSGAGSAKEVREFLIDLGDSDLTYETGDALVLRPSNRAELVDEWLSTTGLRGDTIVELPQFGQTELAVALRDHLEIAKPSRAFLAFVAERSGSRHLQRLLRGDRADLDGWLWERQTVDVIAETGTHASAQEWCELLRPLRERRYSISSSAEVSPRRIRTLVSVVRYDAPSGAARTGVASAFLADAPAGTPIQVAVARSSGFAPPSDPETPMIMIGPGTGLAPFLAFLDTRRARGHTGRNWLFFGEQRKATDFYYSDELAEFARSGLLTRLDTAFSRDQRAKIYVQDRMRERGARLWRWLREGAVVYVCGDAARMAKDVDTALRDVVVNHGDMSAGQAGDYLRQLTADARYLRDVY
ncbi:sulfite reductase (NADPH) flavoprotein alpha-component [Frankia sp. Hr75.2]|nr:sulfite reductase (NADPH) flavoprotein alpha-component [Frankia sp. Hr75.2]